ncbi:DUF1064 domain-containing protein [Bacillus sp. FJAT-49736]|nr:DUF1064 domain-containing protein [Bacillus sp. FJAT-49736]
MNTKKRPKYGNHKTVIDGINFDSKAEAIYYNQLKWLKQAKQIKNFKLQPKYILQEAFTKNGKRFRKIEYVADFEVHKLDGSVEVVDIKGVETKEFVIKRKLFERKYLNTLSVLVYDPSFGFVELDKLKKLKGKVKR